MSSRLLLRPGLGVFLNVRHWSLVTLSYSYPAPSRKRTKSVWFSASYPAARVRGRFGLIVFVGRYGRSPESSPPRADSRFRATRGFRWEGAAVVGVLGVEPSSTRPDRAALPVGLHGPEALPGIVPGWSVDPTRRASLLGKPRRTTYRALVSPFAGKLLRRRFPAPDRSRRPRIVAVSGFEPKALAYETSGIPSFP